MISCNARLRFSFGRRCRHDRRRFTACTAAVRLVVPALPRDSNDAHVTRHRIERRGCRGENVSVAAGTSPPDEAGPAAP